MHVRNTLIWTIIYTSLIYRKNVVYCTGSQQGSGSPKASSNTPDPGGGKANQTVKSDSPSQDSSHKTQKTGPSPPEDSTPSTQLTPSQSSDTTDLFDFADADSDNEADEEPKQPDPPKQRPGATQQAKSPPKASSPTRASPTPARPTSGTNTGSPTTPTGSPGRSNTGSPPKTSTQQSSQQTSGPTSQQATKTPNQPVANQGGTQTPKPTNVASSVTPKTSSSSSPTTKPPTNQSSSQSIGTKPAAQSAGGGSQPKTQGTRSSGQSVKTTVGLTGKGVARTCKNDASPPKGSTPELKSSSDKKGVDPPKPEKLTGVEISLKMTDGTHHFDSVKFYSTPTIQFIYDMIGKVCTYTPKEGYGISSITTKSGSCCSSSVLTIWDAKDPKDYANKVVLEGRGKSTKTLTIHLLNGTTKVLKKNGRNKPWNEQKVPQEQQAPVNTGAAPTATAASEKIIAYDGGFPDGWHDTDMVEKPKQNQAAQRAVVKPQTQPASPKSDSPAKASGDGKVGQAASTATLPSGRSSTQSGVSTQQTGSSAPAANLSRQANSGTQGTQLSQSPKTTITSTPTTTTNSNVKKVIVDNQVADNGCGCTCKNFWCGLFTCGLYNCVKCCKSKSTSRSSSNSSSRSKIELDVAKKETCQNYICLLDKNVYTYEGAFGIYRFNKVKENSTVIWTAVSGESSDKVVYDPGNNKVTIHIGQGKTATNKIFKRGSESKWEEVEKSARTGTVSTASRGTANASMSGSGVKRSGN